MTMFDPATVSESGFFLTVKQKSWERSDSEKSLIRKKEKVKQETLLHHYKLPGFIKGEGGDKIFKAMQHISRSEIKNLNKVGQELACDDGFDDNNSKGSVLGDICLYWPSQYGLTSIDFFARDWSLQI